MEENNSRRIDAGGVSAENCGDAAVNSVSIKLEPEEELSYSCEEENEIEEPPLSSKETKVEQLIKTEAVDCPPSLLNCSQDEIYDAFQQCSKKKKTGKKSPMQLPLLTEVYQTLTQQTTAPNHEEEQFLYHLWLLKFKDLFEPNKVKRGRKRSRLTVSKKSPRSKPAAVSSIGSSNLLDPNDIIIAPESGLNCPPSLQNFTEDSISSAFKFCFKKQANLHYRHSKSLFGKVCTYLTEQKSSTVIERKYLHGLWKLKYKNMIDDRNEEVRKWGRIYRQKYKRRLREKTSLLAVSAVEVDYSNDSNEDAIDNNNDPHDIKCTVLSPPNSATNTIAENSSPNYNNLNSRIALPVANMLAPKVEVESDDGDRACSDFDMAPSSPASKLCGNNDPKLKQKVVVIIKRPGKRSSECPVQGSSTRRKANNRKYLDSLPNASSDNDDEYKNNANSDTDLNDFSYECTKDAKKKSKKHGVVTNHTGSGNCSEVICSVCGRPLSKNLLSFHLRTHFSFEEQKRFLLERREKDRERMTVVSRKKLSGDGRIDQLKKLLESIESQVPKRISEDNVPPVKTTTENKIYVKRDGNYGPVQCDQCGEVIRTIYKLKIHELRKHRNGDENMVKCQICGHPYTCKEFLRKHLPTHLNLEEGIKYSTWAGSIEEFLERLDTGEDLSKPPTHKKGWGRARKVGAPPRKIRKKQGRPRKTVQVTTGQPQQTNAISDNYFSNIHSRSTIAGNSNTSLPGFELRTTDAILPTTSSAATTTTMEEDTLNWNSYTNQEMNMFFMQNIR